jgi:outer membrane protein assembly factor BamD
MQYYKKKHYNKVKTILNEVKIQCSGHESMDSALYYLGKSFLKTKQSTEARMEFEVLIQDFPKSHFFEEVNFLLGVCSYKESSIYERDQTETKEAIREFDNFIESFPKGKFLDSAQHYRSLCIEKLAKKEVMAARFYEKIDQYDAAITYNRIIIENFPESKYIPECRFALARNLFKVNRLKEANKALDELLSLDINTEIKKKAQQLRTRINYRSKTKPPRTKQDTTSDSTNTSE